MNSSRSVKRSGEPEVASERRQVQRPDLREYLLLLRYIVKYLAILKKQPERTECVFLLRAYADILIPGRHLECFLQEHPPLPQPDELAQCAQGSLGHAYAQHLHSLTQQDGAGMQSYQLQANAMEEPQGAALRRRFEDDRIRRRQAVLADQHDLYHLLTGYDTSDVGETRLLAFQAAQVGNGLNILIGLGGIFRTLGRGQWRGALSVWSSYRRGKQTQILLRTEWGSRWHQPLDRVRKALGL